MIPRIYYNSTNLKKGILPCAAEQWLLFSKWGRNCAVLGVFENGYELFSVSLIRNLIKKWHGYCVIENKIFKYEKERSISVSVIEGIGG